MVPDGWRHRTLGEVLRIASRAEEVADVATYRLMGVRWYGDGCHLHSTTVGRELRTKRLFRVAAGDITYNKMWVSKGAFAVVGKEHDGLFATAEYPTFERTDDLVPEFFRYVMLSSGFQAAAQSRLKGSTSRARLNPKDFLQLRALLPPVPEQKKIAAILQSVDNAIAKTQAVIDQTEKVKKGLLQELLTRGMPGQHKRFKRTEIGELPESWSVMTIQEALEKKHLLGVQDGNHGEQHPKAADYRESGVPFIMARDIKNETIDFGSCTFIEQAQADGLRIGFARTGDVLLSHKGTVGTAGIVPRVDGYIMLTPQVTYYRVGDGLMNRFLLRWLQGPIFQRQLERVSRQSTRSYASISAQKELPIAVPPLSEQERIAEFAESVAGSLRASQRNRMRLRQLKKGLAAGLLSGGLRFGA